MGKIRKGLITVITCIALFYNLFTPIRLIVDGGKSLITLVAFFTIYVFGNLLVNKGLLITFLYTIVVCILMLVGVEYFDTTYWGVIISILFSVSVLEYFATTKDLFFAKWVTLTTFLSITILVLLSIPQFILIPDLARLVASEINTGESENVGSLAYWSISYEYIHNLPLLVIPVVVLLKTSILMKYRVLSLFVLLSFIVLSIVAGTTTPLILITLSVVTIYLYKPDKKLSVNISRWLIIGAFLLVILNKATITAVLETILPVFTETSSESRVSNIISFINSGETEGDLALRENVYSITFNSLKDNFFGMEYKINRIGMHSFILDHLAAMGFFIFQSFILFLYYAYKRGASVLYKSKYAFVIAYIFFIAMGLLKNYFLINTIIAIIPLSLALIESKTKLNIKKKWKKQYSLES